MAGAFVSGFKLGGDMYDSAENAKRQKVLDERATTLFEEQRQDRARAVGLRDQEDAVFTYLQNLNAGVGSADQNQIKQTYGMTPQQTAAGVKDGGMEGLRSKLASYDVPDNYELQALPEGVGRSAPAVAPNNFVPFANKVGPAAPVKYNAGLLKQTQASELDQEKALEGISIARRDVAGIRTSKASQKEIGRLTDQRDYMTRLQTLSQDPEKAAEFQAELGPALVAFSAFQGIPANFHFDPKTRQIVSTPYGQTDPKTGQVVYGAPTSVSLETAMPYLLAQRSLIKEYGDPEKAAAAMAKMTDDERTKRIADATRTFAQATGLSTADVAQGTLTESGKHHRALEKAGMITANATATNAKTNAEYKNGMLDHYGRMAGAAETKAAAAVTKAGSAEDKARIRYEDASVWANVEQKLLGDPNTPAGLLAQRKQEFFESRGYATDAKVSLLFKGFDPTGNKFNEQDVDNFNKQFPMTPINKEELPWLKKKVASPAKNEGGGTTQPPARGLVRGAGDFKPEIQVESSRGKGTKYFYKGTEYPTRAAAEMARGQ